MITPPRDRDTLCERAEWLLEQLEKPGGEEIGLLGSFVERTDDFDFGGPLYVALSLNHGGQGTCEYELLSRLLSKNGIAYKPPDAGVKLGELEQLVHDWLVGDDSQ